MLQIKHLIKPRQFGKTWDCITEASKIGAVIVVRDKATVRHIKQTAEERGLTIPNPVDVKDIVNGSIKISENTPVIVDDADLVLGEVLHHNVHTISMVSRDHDGNEEMSGRQRQLMGLE